MTIAYALATLDRDPAVALQQIAGIEWGERWDPQMTDAERAEVHSAKLRVQREMVRQSNHRSKS